MSDQMNRLVEELVELSSLEMQRVLGGQSFSDVSVSRSEPSQAGGDRLIDWTGEYNSY